MLLSLLYNGFIAVTFFVGRIIMRKVHLGTLDHQHFPVTIEYNNKKYFLTQSSEGYKLLSSTCPHMGGEIELIDDKFICPIHQWSFDKSSGECMNSKNKKMEEYEVDIENGNIYTYLPDESVIYSTKERSIQGKRPTIKFHAHACIELISDGFSLLIDPWLDGPAFLGAWIQYPPPIVNSCELKPNAIWISHEHSDHFHEPTLRNFDKSTPIYIPDFPNGRMIQMLKEIGFTNIHAMPFGEPYTIYKNFNITCFEPDSLWNDAMVLIEINGFKILNLNDAGLNHHIATRVAPVDVLASSFSAGASGYPLTWKHLSDEEKISILERSNAGMLQMLKSAMKLYGAKYLLPIASHFELWHPLHREYSDKLVKNTLDDVTQFFKDQETLVIDLLPGERWDADRDYIQRLEYDRNKLYNKALIHQHLKNMFELWRDTPSLKDYKLTRNEIVEYFLKLNRVPEISFCEDLTATVYSLNGSEITHKVSFNVSNGSLHVEDELIEHPNIEISIPEIWLYLIIHDNLSWDEPIIGYWCEFNRNPDVYHGDFWRLLQAPYFRKNKSLDSTALGRSDISITKKMIIADVVEKYGPKAERIMRRYGLYCLGCNYSVSETIELGAKSHGLSNEKMERLVMELNNVIVD